VHRNQNIGSPGKMHFSFAALDLYASPDFNIRKSKCFHCRVTMKGPRKTQVKYDNVTRPSRVSSVVTGETLRQGFLQKLSTGAIKRWQKRYFVVAGHYLNYTEDEDHAQEHDAIKASIDLHNVTEYDASDCKITLAIGTEKHHFKAADQADADEWLNLMQMVTAEHRDRLRKKSLGQFQMAPKASERPTGIPEEEEESAGVKTATLESWLGGEGSSSATNGTEDAADTAAENEMGEAAGEGTGLQRGRVLTFTMSIGSDGSTNEAGAAANYAAAKAAQEAEEEDEQAEQEDEEGTKKGAHVIPKKKESVLMHLPCPPPPLSPSYAPPHLIPPTHTPSSIPTPRKTHCRAAGRAGRGRGGKRTAERPSSRKECSQGESTAMSAAR
jgi:hypothetical protein